MRNIKMEKIKTESNYSLNIIRRIKKKRKIIDRINHVYKNIFLRQIE